MKYSFPPKYDSFLKYIFEYIINPIGKKSSDEIKMPKTYQVNPEILQEFRDWKKIQKERSNHSSDYWLADYMNNFHRDVGYAYNLESSYFFKTGEMDFKLSEVYTEKHYSDFLLGKTAREYYADIREIVDDFGYDPKEMTGSLHGTPSENRRNLAQRMKIFLRMLKQGYCRMDLIG